MVITRHKNYDIQSINLLDLPEEILIKIISYLDFHTIINLRLVCVRINNLCRYSLKSGFNQLIDRFSENFKNIYYNAKFYNAKLDIILSVLIDLIHLRNTIGMYVQQKDCVFFPGELLDEGHRILSFLSIAPDLLAYIHSHDITTRFHVLTSKALKHFNNYVKPICRNLRSSKALRSK